MTHNPLQEKQIVLGVTGGISAYKTVELTSLLIRSGAVVDVIMTEAAQQFVAPLTFQAITHRPVVTEMFSLLAETEIGHVSLAKKADLLIIAPATANTIARLALGLADDMLGTTVLATRSPIIVAPAMETAMWENPMTQEHIRALRKRNMTIVGPAEGRLASGASGMGRMSEPNEILEVAKQILARSGDLAGRSVLITAGGTQEPIDPVRFISNRSSGKMGIALATAARDRGGVVTLISAPTAIPPPDGIALHRVQTAQEMADAVLEHVRTCDALIMAAAVADYRPEKQAEQKMKKDQVGELTLRLTRNPDILAQVAEWKGNRKLPLVIGFAAETQNLIANAEAKLKGKRLDMIAANDVSATDSGFGAETNRVTLLDADGHKEELPLMPKLEVAHHILNWVVLRLSQLTEKD